MSTKTKGTHASDTHEKVATAFTDGSSKGNPGPGGWGSIVTCGDRVVELGGRESPTTNNRMELLAIIEAIKCAASLGAGTCVVATDSSYALKGATIWIAAWRRRGWKTMAGGDVANRDLWEEMSLALDSIETKFVLVEGHVGTPANERCDVIATSFADDDTPGLYDGSVEGYGIRLLDDEGRPFAEKDASRVASKRSSKGSKSSVPAYSYVSCVDGAVMTHSTWKECEARVKGTSGARFKKSFSAAEEASLIEQWGSKKGR